MSRLAGRFGASDVAIAKTCRKHRIPRPWRGYWQKKRHGHPVRRTPLRPLRAGEEDLASVRLGRDRPKVEEETGPVADQKRYEAEHPIVVPERAGRFHPLVAETREHFQPRRGGTRRRRRGPERYLDIRVDSKSRPRAFRIMNALIRALEARGLSVTIDTSRDEPRTVVSVRETTLRIVIEERRRQIEIPPSAADLALADRFPWRAEPRRDLEYTGELALKIDESAAENVRKTWADGKRRKVEECLNSFSIGLVRAAEAKKATEAERQERRRRWEEERRQELEEELRRREEERRGRKLEEAAEAWERAERIRRYVAAVAERAERTAATGPPTTLDEWLAWARAYADRLDPTLPADSPLVSSNPARLT